MSEQIKELGLTQVGFERLTHVNGNQYNCDRALPWHRYKQLETHLKNKAQVFTPICLGFARVSEINLKYF